MSTFWWKMGKGDILRFAFFPWEAGLMWGLFTFLRVNKMQAWNYGQPCCHYEENTAWKWTSNKERQSLCIEWDQVPMVTFVPGQRRVVEKLAVPIQAPSRYQSSLGQIPHLGLGLWTRVLWLSFLASCEPPETVCAMAHLAQKSIQSSIQF